MFSKKLRILVKLLLRLKERLKKDEEGFVSSGCCCCCLLVGVGEVGADCAFRPLDLWTSVTSPCAALECDERRYLSTFMLLQCVCVCWGDVHIYMR